MSIIARSTKMKVLWVRCECPNKTERTEYLIVWQSRKILCKNLHSRLKYQQKSYGGYFFVFTRYISTPCVCVCRRWSDTCVCVLSSYVIHVCSRLSWLRPHVIMTFCCVQLSSRHSNQRSTALSPHSTNTWSKLQCLLFHIFFHLFSDVLCVLLAYESVASESVLGHRRLVYWSCAQS